MERERLRDRDDRPSVIPTQRGVENTLLPNFERFQSAWQEEQGDKRAAGGHAAATTAAVTAVAVPPSPKRRALELVLGLEAKEVVERLPGGDQLEVAAATLEAAASAARAAVEDRALQKAVAARLDEMVLEAQAWMPAHVSASVLRKLLGGLRLKQMKSETVAEDFDENVTLEMLQLEFSMPERWSCDAAREERLSSHKWIVKWAAYYGRGAVAGSLWCCPFFEDPPMSKRLSRVSSCWVMCASACRRAWSSCLSDWSSECIWWLRSCILSLSLSKKFSMSSLPRSMKKETKR